VISRKPLIAEAEAHFNVDLDGYLVSVFFCGLEGPLLHGFEGFGVETRTERTYHASVAERAIGSDDCSDNYCAGLESVAAGLGILRLGIGDDARRCDAAYTSFQCLCGWR